jgi:glucose-6-phosphate 1-dehydrogenase
MSAPYSDALVFFGATGDLVFKKIFPALQAMVEEAWRIVDPALQAGTPVHEYEPRTWGPGEAESVMPPGGWSNPVVTT